MLTPFLIFEKEAVYKGREQNYERIINDRIVRDMLRPTVKRSDGVG